MKFIKFLLKSSISNEEVLEGKHRPFWQALIVMLISLIIAVIPVFTSIARTSGSAILNSSNNVSIDTSLVLFSKYLKDNNLDVKIDANGKVDVKNTKLTEDGSLEYVIKAQDTNLLYVRIIDVIDDTSTKENEESLEIQKYQEMYSAGKENLEDSPKETPHSYFLISENYVNIVTYARTSATVNTIENGLIKNHAQTTANFGGENACTKNTSFASFYNEDSYADCLTKWSNFLNDSYSASKTRYLWSYTGLITALNVGVALIVSLLIMILTRLKSASGEKLNYFEALKINSFASFSPAILGLVIGFIFPRIASIGFVLFLGIRSTFLGMKAANPQK